MEPRDWQKPTSEYAKDWRDRAPSTRPARRRTHPVAWVLLGACAGFGIALRLLGQ